MSSCVVQRFCFAIVFAIIVTIIGAIVGALVAAIVSVWILKSLLVCVVAKIALSESSLILFEHMCTTV